MISIITPWHGETGHLLADYYRAVEGGLAEVISIDNGCPPATADALKEMTEHLQGRYIRNEQNAGFAAANNQGCAKATGDIIVFLNSDVAPAGPWLHQVLADIRHGALYGPSLGYQLVAGRHLPYIEGWCVGATRETWEQIANDPNGPFSLGVPWDSERYPGPYWEDNDLCFRALQQGLSLVQTTWPIQHKGGQTAGPIMRHGESFARNERTFTERVLQALTALTPTSTWPIYMQQVHTQSDIQHHLPLLYSLARGNVVELGTRTGVSTAALLAGVEARGGHVWSVDIDDCGGLFAEHPQWTFRQGSSIDPATREKVAAWNRNSDDKPTAMAMFNLVLIDTEHNIEQVSAELELWAPRMAPGSHILIHDPETFPGVRRAITEFCTARSWPVTFVLPCNGMAVIEVPG